jgi:molybdate transport system permease protein
MLAGNMPGQTQTMPMAIYFVPAEAIFWTTIAMAIALGSIIAVNAGKV